VNLYLRLLWLNIRVHFRPQLKLLDTAVTAFRVWPTDLDPLMHMNNGKYLSIMDLGRMDLMIRSGTWAKLKHAGWHPVVAGQTISYFKSLNPWQRFEVHTRILGLDDRWGYLEQRFTRGETLYARAIVRSRFLKRSGGSVNHDEFEAVIGHVPGDEGIPEWVLEWSRHARPIAHPAE
jgi:acyl-CoA thioesterase FadM